VAVGEQRPRYRSADQSCLVSSTDLLLKHWILADAPLTAAIDTAWRDARRAVSDHEWNMVGRKAYTSLPRSFGTAGKQGASWQVRSRYS
jgi:hypothetical protein